MVEIREGMAGLSRLNSFYRFNSIIKALNRDEKLSYWIDE